MSKKYLAQAELKSSDSKTKYSMYIGRWQPWHQGHRWLIDQRLNDGKNVLICIRDVEPDEKNPWTSKEVENNLKIELKDLITEGKVVIYIIPDIESINIGRGVGYDVIEHIPPDEISEVSATKIREKMKQDGKL
jgi:nicotinamide mononucleotide adenylyltransferase